VFSLPLISLQRHCRAERVNSNVKLELGKLSVLWSQGVTAWQMPAVGRDTASGGMSAMKKLKNEKELVKKAIAAGMKYGEERGVVEFEPTDSQTEKIEYIYRLLVHDKIIQPVPQEQISQLAMKHRLAMWAAKLK
jgi:hypothetical protein